MKKQTKISGQIPQLGLDLLLENSQEINSKEMELQNKISSENQNKNSNFIIDSLDFLTYGGFSIRNQNIAHRIEKNNTRITFEKAKEKIEKSKLPTKPISLKLQQNFLANISLEEDKNLQERWANMLANALTGKIEIEVNYIKILSELSEFDVHILNEIYKNTIPINTLCNFKNLDEKTKVHLDNLISKRLIESPKITGDNTINFPFPIQSNTYEAFELTSLGKAFINSCKFDDESEKIQDNDKILYKVDSSKMNALLEKQERISKNLDDYNDFKKQIDSFTAR